MKFPRALVVSGLVLACLAGSGRAEEQSASNDLWLLAKYDTNGDQVISQDEVSGRRDRMFGHLDLDQDGLVKFSEYQSLDVRKRELLLKARFDKLDLDGDGELSAEEYRSYLGSFDRFDRDGDGRISAADINQVPAAVAVSQSANTRCVLWFCVRGNLD
jgi:Ca2+-binding EF-hand superfamily protein